MSALPEAQVGARYPLPPDFDPLTQPIYFLYQNGSTGVVLEPFTFDELDFDQFYTAQWSTVYGCALGAGVMTLLHVVALTPLSKRRTLIYWLNVIGLVQVIARGVFQSLYFTRDRFNTFYVMLSGDSHSVPTLHRLHSTFNIILALTSVATVEVIFFVQGRAILSSLPRHLYFLLMGGLVLFGCIAVTVRLALAVYDTQATWVHNQIERNGHITPLWLEPATLITYVITIGAWSFVWSCFIGRQIFLRWKMNIMRGKSFGAMNVLFLAGIQSMILPVFFLVMQFVPAEKTFLGAEALVIPSVLCLMPFSCLWAGTISSANGQGCDETTKTHHSHYQPSSAKIPFARLFSANKSKSSDEKAAQPPSDNSPVMQLNGSPKKKSTPHHLDKFYPELHDDDHIGVTQSYTVHSDKSSHDGSIRNDSAV